MTIAAAMDRVQRMKPSRYTPRDMMGWLDELDGRIWREIILTHEGKDPEADYEGYDQETNPETILLVPYPYDGLYEHWMACKIDQGNMELGKYENDRILFNNAFEEYANWYNAHHMPLKLVDEFRF